METNLLLVTLFANIFSQSVGCVFILFIVFFAVCDAFLKENIWLHLMNIVTLFFKKQFTKSVSVCPREREKEKETERETDKEKRRREYLWFRTGLCDHVEMQVTSAEGMWAERYLKHAVVYLPLFLYNFCLAQLLS